MKKLSQAIAEVKYKDRPKNIAYEFQMYGVYLAESLGDTKHYSLYIKLAKEQDAGKLRQLAKSISERSTIRNKGAYFMSCIVHKKKQ